LINKIVLSLAIALSAIAAFFSIAGLVAIFSAAVIPIIIMGSFLEAAKVVSISWLYRNWKECPATIRYYLIIAIAILMIITSMGTFGYLSKAHSDQSIVSGDVLNKLEVYNEKINLIKENIDSSKKALKQNDEAVDQLMGRSKDERGAERAISVRKAQQSERVRIQGEIKTLQKDLDKLYEERAPILSQARKVEAEVGPIKYIASLFYGNSISSEVLEKAVRLVIILIVIVFDPLAVILLIAANHGIKKEKTLTRTNKKGIIEIDKNKITTFN